MIIPDILAQELLDLESGEKDATHRYQKVANYNYRDSRWSSWWYCVFVRLIDGSLWAFEYELGLTEAQPSRYPWDSWLRENDEGVECFEVVSIPKTIVTYFPKK